MLCMGDDFPLTVRVQSHKMLTCTRFEQLKQASTLVHVCLLAVTMVQLESAMPSDNQELSQHLNMVSCLSSEPLSMIPT